MRDNLPDNRFKNKAEVVIWSCVLEHADGTFRDVVVNICACCIGVSNYLRSYIPQLSPDDEVLQQEKNTVDGVVSGQCRSFVSELNERIQRDGITNLRGR